MIIKNKTLDGPNFQKKSGGNSVATAAKHDCWNLVRVLSETGAHAGPQVSDELGTTPLVYVTSSSGDLNLMQMLIDGGADSDSPSEIGYVPLQYSAYD